MLIRLQDSDFALQVRSLRQNTSPLTIARSVTKSKSHVFIHFLLFAACTCRDVQYFFLFLYNHWPFLSYWILITVNSKYPLTSCNESCTSPFPLGKSSHLTYMCMYLHQWHICIQLIAHRYLMISIYRHTYRCFIIFLIQVSPSLGCAVGYTQCRSVGLLRRLRWKVNSAVSWFLPVLYFFRKDWREECGKGSKETWVIACDSFLVGLEAAHSENEARQKWSKYQPFA